jgi:hypothetical protein
MALGGEGPAFAIDRGGGFRERDLDRIDYARRKLTTSASPTCQRYGVREIKEKFEGGSNLQRVEGVAASVLSARPLPKLAPKPYPAHNQRGGNAADQGSWCAVDTRDARPYRLRQYR